MSEYCDNCGKTREEHKSGWGKKNEYCIFYPNIHFKPKGCGDIYEYNTKACGQDGLCPVCSKKGDGE